MVLSNHKSIACLYLHQPDFDIIHHVIYGVTFFIQGHSSKNLEWCWPSGAAVVLGEDHQRNTIMTVQAVFSHVFSFPFLLVDQFFCPVIRFTPVRNAVF